MIPLLASLVLVQAESAEDSFRKIEESLTGATCVRVSFVWDGASKADADARMDARGNVLLKKGNRASLVASVTERGQASELRIVSDGTTVKARLGPKRLLECETPRNLEAGLKMALYRLGAMQAVLIAHKVCMLDPGDQADALDLGKRPTLSDFKPGPDDGDCRTITYKITPDGAGEGAADVKLWYAPETYKLVKRTITLRRPAESVFTEVYKDWTIDGELENDEFALPTVK